jgi:hypothetical protein
MGSVLLR